MEAKQSLHSFSDRLTKASRLTRKPPKGSNITASLTQGNLGTHKDNPIRDNVRPLVVHLLLI